MKPHRNYGPFTLREPVTKEKALAYLIWLVVGSAISVTMYFLVYGVIRPTVESLF